MKSDIHPKWNHNAVVTCSCGNTFTTGSTQDSLTVDICSACHPFFTGEMKFVDRQGRVDKFLQKMKTAEQKKKDASSKKKKATKSDDNQAHLSYKQLLQQQKKAISAVKNSPKVSDDNLSAQTEKSDDKVEEKTEDK